MLDLEGGLSLVRQRWEQEIDKKRETKEEIKIFLWGHSHSSIFHFDPNSLTVWLLVLPSLEQLLRKKQLCNMDVSMWLCNMLVFIKGTVKDIIRLDDVYQNYLAILF